MDNTDEFHAAATWLSGAPDAARMPNDLKLQVYALYKFATTGAGPTGPRPSIFYPTLRAKYDAYLQTAARLASLSSTASTSGAGDAVGAGAGGGAEREARARYIAIARDVGWDGRVEEVDLETLSDDDGDGDGGGKAAGKAAAGDAWITHSVMMDQDDEPIPAQTPMHGAATTNDLDKVRELVRHRKSLVLARDEFGYTPLHLAADRGHVEMTKLLLSLGADRDAIDHDEMTPLQLAEITQRDEIIDILKQY